MLTVTSQAKEALGQILDQRQHDSNTAIRIARANEGQGNLKFVLAEENSGDQVVSAEDGTKLLLVNNELSQTLDGLVLDYVDSGESKGFTVSQPAAGAGQA
ncbi:MAG: hypothetical protein GF418_15030 [Chitinivibrionales bacterium]|nr:hypothetical protein [Chitinivibrionales bacterium]MBD3396934.1 hypothetical protein [Chitinivibrionales bacterium]